MNIEQFSIYLLYTLLYIGFALVLKLVLDARASGHYCADSELRNNNLSVGLRRSGAQLGLAIAMMGVLLGEAQSTLLADLKLTLIYGALATAFIFSSLFVTDKLVLPGVNNTAQLKEGNKAVGCVEFGMMVATGVIAYASIVGEGGGILQSLCYFAAGQVALVLLVLVYEKIVIRRFDLVNGVKEGNVSAGLYLAGKLIAYALILKASISGNGSGATPAEMIQEFLFVAAAGMVLLFIFELLIDLLIVTAGRVRQILSQDQVVPALQLSMTKVGVALIISNAIL